jgi:hypothetical protein
MSMRLLKIDRRPSFAVWTYWHPTRGTFHALVGDHEPNVTHVGGRGFCVSGCRSRNSRQRKPANQGRSRHQHTETTHVELS